MPDTAATLPDPGLALAALRPVLGDRLAGRLADRALAVGGTVSGEHGIGTAKLGYLRREHGDAAVEMLKAIKSAIDPRGIMNPGKMGQRG